MRIGAPIRQGWRKCSLCVPEWARRPESPAAADHADTAFLKLNMKLAKAALPAKTPHGDLMRCISERWKAAGAVATQAEHEAHWREMALEGLGGLKL